MKIMMLSWEYPPRIVGGIARVVHDLSHNFARSGNEVHVITYQEGDTKEFEKDGVEVYLEHEVVKIQPEYNKILVNDINGKQSFLTDYDNLIIATGANPILPKIKNINLKNVFSVRNIEDGINIKAALKFTKSAVIIGSGYIGMEILEAFVSNEIFTTVVEMSENIMPYLDSDMSKTVYEELSSINNGRFEFLTGQIAAELRGDCDGVKEVVTDKGNVIKTDIVIICAGVKPNVKLALDAGIELGKNGAIRVDKYMQTNFKNI